jgi:type I restriction-modification system DNA methylase subunit
MTRQDGKEAVHKLVEDFKKNEREYMSKNFQETEVRTRFIDPFFTALGWEVNQTGIAKKFWDVHREFNQRDNSVNKKPDYVFRVKEGVKHKEKFFVEAKAPHVDLEGNIPVFQAKRYAFSSHGKTPIAILTDFQTFMVFNGLEKPVYSNPLQGRIKDFNLEYHGYIEKWDMIWDAFSKEAVAGGSIEKLIGKTSRNYKSLDDEFLADISIWRETLARNIAIRNKDLSVDHINEAVQRILDRLIFIRNLEDRGIESEEGLLFITKVKENIYPHLVSRFRSLDKTYNGQLFKEHFSENITVDDNVIKDIIKALYPPLSPYQFDMIEPEILGRIYERFLGSKIRLTESHQAKVEEKPEVRHAGGVYYTPQYIVDYIVENTVGVKIKNKTPEEIEAVKICDPACGSGSFLLGAFSYLIEYHREWYAKSDTATQKGYRNDFFFNAENEIQLTLKKKADILKNNIFGVDIDREATEVAIMSLYLKILDEGQTELFLPDITGNIKCGNSLIGTDFYAQGGLDLTEDEIKKANCFDWNEEFGSRDDTELFDVVIGNPPYVNIENLEDNAKNYFFSHYKTCKGRTDIYIVFLEKTIGFLRNNGFLSFIIPYAFTNQIYGMPSRENIINNMSINQIVDTSNYFIFKNANVKNIILVLEKAASDKMTRIIKYNSEENFLNGISTGFLINQHDFLKLKDSRLETKHLNNNLDIKEKIWKHSIEFGKICFIGYGARLNHKTKNIQKSHYIHAERQEGYKPFLEGRNINRYQFMQDGWLDYKPKEHYNSMFPELFENEKLINIRIIKDRIRYAYDDKGFYNSHTVVNSVRYDKLVKANHISAKKALSRIEIAECKNYSYKYLIGILNSSLINWYFVNFISDSLNFYPNDAKSLPVRKIDFSKNRDKVKHDNLVSLVDKMLELKQKEAAERGDHLKTLITRQISVLDKTIDAAVYELYGLTDEEIKLVEEKK